jgi:hypothetical protein
MVVNFYQIAILNPVLLNLHPYIKFGAQKNLRIQNIIPGTKKLTSQ